MTEYRKPAKSSEPIDLGCPTPVEALMAVMARSTRNKPKMFPADRREAAIFWIQHQEPAIEHAERARKEGTSWVTPYHDRLCRTLRIFLGFNNLHQTLVIEYAKTVPWRGDAIDFYNIAIKQELLRQKNPKAYVEATFKAMHDFKFNQLPSAPDDPDQQAKRPL
jgi:hypothetical protein